MLVRQGVHADLHTILIVESVLKNIKLQHAYHAYDDLLHTGVELLEDLDGALLGDLLYSLYKLLALHGIHLGNPGKMLRRKGGNTLKFKLFRRGGKRISDGVDTGIKNSYDISGVCLLHHMSVISHHLLRLGQSHVLSALDMMNRHARIKLSGAYAHKGDPVTVRLVHIGLDLKNKS